MPTFPTYYGPPLPDKLKPVDPRHWWLLLTWVFFYPSRLKHYLYQADSGLYVERGMAGFLQALRQPTYSALLFTSLLTTVVISFIFWGIATLLGFNVDWRGVVFGVTSGVTFSLALGMPLGMMFSVANGVTTGLAFGVAFGAAPNVAFGMMGITFGIAFGITFGVTSGFVDDVTNGVTRGIVAGLALGIAFGVVGSVMNGVANGMVVSATFGVGFLLGILQLPSWLIEWATAQKPMPLLNESGILPPPSAILDCYQQRVTSDPASALKRLRPLLSNSIRAHSAWHSLNQCLHNSSDPLQLFYTWLRDPQIDEYIFIPFASFQFYSTPSVRRALLGSLGNCFVDYSNNLETKESLVWLIARRFYRAQADHPLVPLAQLLFILEQLHDIRGKISKSLPVAFQKQKDVESLLALPHGDEIAVTFALLGQAYQVIDLTAAIARLQPALAKSYAQFPDPLRPEVMEVLSALSDIGQEIVAYTQASNLTTQGAALNRAIGLLNELAIRVAKVRLPESALLTAIVDRWQQVVAAEAGRVGARSLSDLGIGARYPLAGNSERQSHLWQRPALPFANPYITGRPVSPPLFVGRNDILHQIAERWRTSHTPDSIILYGHRRMGKTSIVQNLDVHAPTGSMLVYLDLAGATATAEHSGDLLLDLADKIHAAAFRRLPDLPQPQFGDYQQVKSADLHFQRLLRAVIDGLPDGAFLLLALDEFEALERAVMRGKLPMEVYGYLRMLSQQPRLLLVLAGLHTLDEMSRDYQQAFFSSYHNVRVSYLPFHEAERLIARPTPDFTLNYKRSVIEAIYHQTYGQPLLIQSICSALVNQLNHELFDLELQREARILPADLDAILTDNFVQKESRYFEGIWRDQIADFPNQQRLLHILAHEDTTLTVDQLVTLSGLSVAEVSQALQALAKRDVVIEEGGEWRLLMPLFQRWLRLQESQNG